MRLAEPAIRSVARSLAIDLATAEVVAAFRDSGIRSVVLRGPAIERRIYADGELRPYVDVDLLVAPSDEHAAGLALARLGFAEVVSDEELAGFRPVHAHEWLRERDGVAVDLHRTLAGVGVDGEAVFSSVLANADVELVGGAEVTVPSAAALALQIGLHAAHHGPRRAKSLRDLERAIERLPRSAWQDAAALAERFDAVAAFGAGLRLSPAGTELAAELRLPTETSVGVRLRASSAPPLALGIDWLTRAPGMRAKARLLCRTIAPPRGALRSWRPLARRRRRGLLLAYVSHPLWLAWHTVPSLLAVRRARKEAR